MYLELNLHELQTERRSRRMQEIELDHNYLFENLTKKKILEYQKELSMIEFDAKISEQNIEIKNNQQSIHEWYQGKK